MTDVMIDICDLLFLPNSHNFLVSSYKINNVGHPERILLIQKKFVMSWLKNQEKLFYIYKLYNSFFFLSIRSNNNNKIIFINA